MRKVTEGKAVRFGSQIYHWGKCQGSRIVLVTVGMVFLLSTVTARRAQAQSITALDGATGSAGLLLTPNAASNETPLDGLRGGSKAQTAQAADAPAAGAQERRTVHVDPEGLGRIGAGVRISTLGAGGEVAAALTHTTNIRGGFNFFSYSRGYDNNGIHYAGDLQWASAEAHLDWFPLGHAFHLSPGLMVYNDNHVNATASIPGGQTFTLDNTSYMSNPANPVGGTAKLYFTKVDPTVMIGFGNLVPRNGSHFSVNFEVGVAFEGSPKINLNLNGSACAPDGTNCQDVQSTSSIQNNVQGEQAKLANDLAPFKYYPLMSLTIGYRF
jgi:hypothetical protein